MKHRPLGTILLLFLLAHSVHAKVELIAGAQKTEPVSEPFSVDFDSTRILYADC